MPGEDESAYYSQRKYLGDLIRRKLPAARPEEAKCKQESIRIIHDSKGKDDLQDAINNASETIDDQLQIIWTVSNIIRNDILKRNKEKCAQSNPLMCTDDHPSTLLSFLRWLLFGKGNLKGQRDSIMQFVCNSLAGQLSYNIKSDRQASYTLKNDETSRFHSYHEPALIVKISLALRKCGRRSTTLDMLHNQGLTLPYARCLLYETGRANAIITSMQKNNVFIPIGCKQGVRPSFHLDNTVWNEDREMTIHNLLLVGFQDCDPEDSQLDITIPKSQTLIKN